MLRATLVVWVLGVAGVGVGVGVVVPTGGARAGDPQMGRQLTDKGIELQQSGDHAGALQMFDAALGEIDHPKIRYFRAKSYRALGRFDEALAEFQRIRDAVEVQKYHAEIASFIREIEGERERVALEKRLADERAARQKAEAESLKAELAADEASVLVLKSARSGLLPSAAVRAQDGATLKRVVPRVPAFEGAPESDVTARLVRRDLAALDRYDAQLWAAKSLILASVAGVAIGGGLALNPFAEDRPKAEVQTAGIVVGVVGAVAGIAAAIVWPSVPRDNVRVP